jgi:hypothetical protein
MKIATREADGITVVALEGSVLGGPDATALNDVLHKLVEKKKKKIVLDLAIAAASKKSESLLVITKLSTVFTLYPSVKKAIGSFQE